ncbi:MAG: hypothetical protein BMS9Abin37_3228 [Acidobacteriota bacterium]|nr:MAG: hypothetical protein BMS9Abin37_3228 [Acidobacteriota bacterium]
MTQVRSVDWKMRGEWIAREKPLVLKTLTEIGKYPGLVGDIRRALDIEEGEEPELEVEREAAPAFTLDDALHELFLPRDDVEEALELLRYKKYLVLQGPPGVGKTFFAKRLAYLLLGERDPDRVDQGCSFISRIRTRTSYKATGLLMMANLRGPMAPS